MSCSTRQTLPRPDPDTPAPVRCLPEYDNVLLGHADGSGVDERVAALFGERPVGLGSILIDGRVQGTWRVQRGGSRREPIAVMRVRTVEALVRRDREAVAAEAGRLLAFLAEDAETREVTFA